ncbi:hypothetical protein FQR65_LT16274 [Abscondita terminalis]|nr:hypothetical protein FQR65_LT16274 [Abscondita terminalis]
MKKIFLTLFITAAGIGVNARYSKLEKLFDQYQDTKGVTSIKIAKPMFNLLNKLDIQDAGIDQIRPLIKDVNSIKILIFEKNKKDSIAPTVNMSKIRDEINSSIKNLKYEELMTVNSDGKKIKFLTQDTTTSVVKDLLLSITGNDENLFLLLDGKVNVDDISKLVNSDEKGDKGDKGSKGDKGKILLPSKKNSDNNPGISEQNFDFGDVKKGDHVEHTYTVTNTGDQPLVISAVKPGCGCTAPDYTKVPILPGQKGKVTLNFDSGSFEGLQNKYAEVYTNTEKSPTQQQGGGSMMFIMMAVMLVGFYFLMLRPQMKKQKQEKNFQESIKPGARVVTTSGMHGKIVNVMEDGVIIETMSGKLKFEKAAISREFTEARFGDKKAPAAKETPKENKVKEITKEEKENVTNGTNENRN